MKTKLSILLGTKFLPVIVSKVPPKELPVVGVTPVITA